MYDKSNIFDSVDDISGHSNSDLMAEDEHKREVDATESQCEGISVYK
jgi:hypothetical protein